MRLFYLECAENLTFYTIRSFSLFREAVRLIDFRKNMNDNMCEVTFENRNGQSNNTILNLDFGVDVFDERFALYEVHGQLIHPSHSHIYICHIDTV